MVQVDESVFRLCHSEGYIYIITLLHFTHI